MSYRRLPELMGLPEKSEPRELAQGPLTGQESWELRGSPLHHRHHYRLLLHCRSHHYCPGG